jgi:ornithine cyclodeaminase
VLRGASVFVEYEPQTRIEGDLQHLPADFAVTELWQVLSNKAAGRTHETQVTLFDSVGFALEDYSALRFMRDAAHELGIGEWVSLIPELVNPKDLFSLIRPVTAPAVSAARAAATPQAHTDVQELALAA